MKGIGRLMLLQYLPPSSKRKEIKVIRLDKMQTSCFIRDHLYNL
jgi:hypothetical protein